MRADTPEGVHTMIAQKHTATEDPLYRQDIFLENDHICVVAKTTNPQKTVLIHVTRATNDEITRFDRRLNKTEWDAASGQLSLPFDEVQPGLQLVRSSARFHSNK